MCAASPSGHGAAAAPCSTAARTATGGWLLERGSSLGSQQDRGAEHLAIGGLHQDGDPLAGSRRVDRDLHPRALPGAERRQRLDAVGVFRGAARILAGADTSGALLDEA